jgi:hypothetical protein
LKKPLRFGAAADNGTGISIAHFCDPGGRF